MEYGIAKAINVLILINKETEGKRNFLCNLKCDYFYIVFVFNDHSFNHSHFQKEDTLSLFMKRIHKNKKNYD